MKSSFECDITDHLVLFGQTRSTGESEVMLDDIIGLPNIDPQTSQAVNPETSTRLRELVETYLAALELAGEVRRELAREIEAARAHGHSFPQLNEESGLSIATIQKILVAVAVERASLKS